MDTLACLVSAISWFFSSLVSGLCGIGGGIVAMPAMMLVISDTKEVILASSLTSVAMTAAMAFFYFRHCIWKHMAWLALGLVPGGMAGVRVLTTVSTSILEIVVGSMMLFCVLGLQFFQGHIKRTPGAPMSVVTGFLVGAVGTSIVIDGPLIALYTLAARWTPLNVLGTTSVLFFLRCSMSAFLQYRAGLFTEPIVECALWSMPMSVLGFVVSIPIVRRIRPDVFRAILKVVIVFAGVFCLARGLGLVG